MDSVNVMLLSLYSTVITLPPIAGQAITCLGLKSHYFQFNEWSLHSWPHVLFFFKPPCFSRSFQICISLWGILWINCFVVHHEQKSGQNLPFETNFNFERKNLSLIECSFVGKNLTKLTFYSGWARTSQRVIYHRPWKAIHFLPGNQKQFFFEREKAQVINLNIQQKRNIFKAHLADKVNVCSARGVCTGVLGSVNALSMRSEWDCHMALVSGSKPNRRQKTQHTYCSPCPIVDEFSRRCSLLVKIEPYC